MPCPHGPQSVTCSFSLFICHVSLNILCSDAYKTFWESIILCNHLSLVSFLSPKLEAFRMFCYQLIHFADPHFICCAIAIGSNKEAAALSGINTKFYHVMVYVVCGLFTGLAAIAYAAVTPTVQPGTGAGLEMDAIGGVFVGGVAATGGYGSVIGTFVGIFVIMLLKTGLPYIGLQANWQQIITGIVLIVAVLIDILKEKKAAH